MKPVSPIRTLLLFSGLIFLAKAALSQTAPSVSVSWQDTVAWLVPAFNQTNAGPETPGGQNSGSGTANNVNDITNWIKDRMAEEASSGVSRHFTVEGESRNGFVSYSYDVQHRQEVHGLTISGCKVSYRLNESYIGKVTEMTHPHDSGGVHWSGDRTFNDSHSIGEDRVEFDLQSIQPSLIVYSSDDDEWIHTTPNLNGDLKVEKVQALCANEQGCSIAHVNFVSVGEALTIKNSNGPVPEKTVHSVWYPVSTSELAQRLVNAWRDAAKACGGKDLNKSLY